MVVSRQHRGNNYISARNGKGAEDILQGRKTGSPLGILRIRKRTEGPDSGGVWGGWKIPKVEPRCSDIGQERSLKKEQENRRSNRNV